MSEVIYFAAGCFWGVEETFRTQVGVIKTTVGYTGGHTEHPTYDQVGTDRTGHAETVKVEFNPEEVTAQKLLEIFWKIHDPTTVNRQGPDVGSQYRSAIFYTTEDQAKIALDSKSALDNAHIYNRPVVTEILPAGTFWPAEEYHQQYFLKHGGGTCQLEGSTF